MASTSVRNFIVKALQQFYDKLSTDYLSSKENSTNKVTSLSSSSTDTEYPSAKSVYDKFTSLDGSANIASVSNGIVTIKADVTETDGIISNGTNSDVVLHKIATSGSPNDMNVQYANENVTLSTALTNIKSGIDAATSAGTQYIVSGSTATTPNTATYNGSNGTLAPSSSTTGKVYLVPSSTNDSFTQYVTTQSGSSYQWTSLGSTTVDLTGVVKIITVNGKQFAVAEGTTLIDLGDVVKTVTGQAAISNPNTDYAHVIVTTTKDASTGSNTVTLAAQLKTGNITAGTSGLATIEDIKNYIDSKIVIRTWSNT